MLLAMGITAFLCIFIGVYPEPLYAILPFPVDYTPYTTSHVITQLQLLLFALMAFVVLIRKGMYPAEMKSLNLDTDWIYRRFLPCAIQFAGKWVGRFCRGVRNVSLEVLDDIIALIEEQHGTKSMMSRSMHAGTMALIISSVLLVFLVMIMI